MKVIFMSSAEIAIPCLQELIDLHQKKHIDLQAVITSPDKKSGRGLKIQTNNIKEKSLANNIKIFQPISYKNSSAKEIFAKLEPDLIIVFAYGFILPKWLLDLPKIACLNIHTSLLPRHRGASPIQASILAGDKLTGITIMHMAPGLDTGDIFLTKEMPINEDDTALDLHNSLSKLAPLAMLKALNIVKTLNREKFPRIKQDDNLASYAGKISKADGKINWHESPTKIKHKILAYHSWPGTFSQIKINDKSTKRVKIFPPITIKKAKNTNIQAGKITELNKDFVSVECGSESENGTIQIKQIQIEGGKNLTPAEIMTGYGNLKDKKFLS